jgi:hypothetical protein
MEELLSGRGGEECNCFTANSTSSWWSYPCCFRCGGNTSKLFLSANRGGEGEESDGAAALHWKWCLWRSCESATFSAAPKHRHHAAAILGRWDGPVELEQFRSSSDFLLLCWRIYSDVGTADNAMASPSGFVPFPVELVVAAAGGQNSSALWMDSIEFLRVFAGCFL